MVAAQTATASFACHLRNDGESSEGNESAIISHMQRIQTAQGQCHAQSARALNTLCDRAAEPGIDQQLASTTNMHTKLVDRQRRLCS